MSLETPQYLTNSKSRLVWLALPVLIVALFCTWFFWDSIMGLSYAPQVLITDMGFADYNSDCRLMLRAQSPDSSTLLLKTTCGKGLSSFENAGNSFRYDKDGDSWESALGVTTICDIETASPQRSLPGTYGRITVGSKRSNSGHTALVTTNGAQLHGIGLLFPTEHNSGRIVGQRYFEMIAPNGAAANQVFKVRKFDYDVPRLCWSADSGHVVITDQLFSTLAVIKISDN